MCVKLSPFIDSKHLVLDYVVTLLHDPLQITVGSYMRNVTVLLELVGWLFWV